MAQSDKKEEKEKERESQKAKSALEKEKKQGGKAVEKLKFYGVVAFLSLLCAGFIWFIFKPAAARNFLNAIERIPSIIDQYKAKNEVLEREIPQLQEIAGKVWKKEEELKQLKSELAALDRKIQLELAPPTPEITEKEHEGQQVKPEAKGVRNGIRQYPEDTSPQIRNPSESIIANHTITGHPGLYAKEETRSKGLKI